MDASSFPRSVALVQARAWADQKRWEKVVELTPRLLAENPGNLAAYLLAARAHVNQGRKLKAKKLAAECLRLGPNNAEAHCLAAYAEFNLGNLAQAQINLQTALALNSGWAGLHRFQAQLYLRQGEATNALQALRMARSLAPNDPEIFGDLVELESAGRHLPSEVKETTRRYEEALKLDPGNGEIHFKLGLHQLNLEGDYPRATENLAVALRGNPNNKAIRNAYLRALRHTDRFIYFLFTPVRWAQLMDRLLHRKYRTRLEESIWAIWAIPIFAVWVICGLYFAVACWLPAVLYGALTLTDFRVKATNQLPGSGPPWSWGCWPSWLRTGTVTILLLLPWILVGLICLDPNILEYLAWGFLGWAWIYLGWWAVKWIYEGWKRRRFARHWILPSLRILVVVIHLGILIWVWQKGSDLYWAALFFYSLAGVPLALWRCNRSLLAGR